MRARIAVVQPLGPLVRTSRDELHLTQSELARRVGVSRSTIAEIEAGRIHEPRAGVAANLAKALGLPLAALLAAAGYPETEGLLKMEGDELALLAASLPQLAGAEREWLHGRLIEIRDLLLLRRGRDRKTGRKGAQAGKARR